MVYIKIETLDEIKKKSINNIDNDANMRDLLAAKYPYTEIPT